MKVASTLTPPMAHVVAAAWSAGVEKPAAREDSVGVVDDRIDPGDLLEHGEAQGDRQGSPHARGEHLFPGRGVVGVEHPLGVVELGVDVFLAADSAQCGGSVFSAADLHVPARCVPHRPHRDRQQHRRNRGNTKHQPPAVGVRQRLIHKVRDEDADGDRELVRGHEPTTEVGGSGLGCIERRSHRCDSHAEADHETSEDQQRGAGGERFE